MALSVWCRYHRQFQHQWISKKQRQIGKWIHPEWHRRSCLTETAQRLWMPGFQAEAFHSISSKQSCCSTGINCSLVPYLKCWETYGTVQKRSGEEHKLCKELKVLRCQSCRSWEVMEYWELNMCSKVQRGRQGQAAAYRQSKGSWKESLMKAEIILGDSEYWYSQRELRTGKNK